MKSRLAIISTLAVGMVFSTAGIGMAVSGLSGGDNAGVAQYGTPVATPTGTPTTPPAATPPAPPVPAPTPGLVAPAPTPTGTVAGETESNSPSDSGDSAPTGGVQGETETQPSSSNVQPAAQVQAGDTSGNELPFTGFAAIPVILVGALLLTVGMVMRRRNSDES